MASLTKKRNKLMQSHGFELHRETGKHLVWRDTSGHQLSTSKTPSDRHSFNQIERDIRRLLNHTY